MFSNSNTSSLKNEYFKWNTIDGNAPYEINVLLSLDELADVLNNNIYGVGINNAMKDYMLTFMYN
jgi:hypothetical protein